jgi:dienelactone hydrolase
VTAPRPFAVIAALATLACALGVAFVPAADFVRGASMVARAAALDAPAARRLATFGTVEVSTRDLEVPSRSGLLRARLYEPAGALTRTVVLTPGVHAEGIDEPRLTKFARDIAAGGFAVITAELPDLLRYEITARLPDQIEDVAAWAASQRALAPDGRVGIVGISFSGGLSIVAAGRPTLAGRVAFTLSFGGHGDLARTMRYLCTGVQPDGSLRPPHDYGVVVLLLNYAPFIVPAEQVEPLRAGIRTFLKASHVDMVDKTAARAIFERAIAMEPGLPEPSRRLLRAVNAREVDYLGPLVLPYLDAVELPDSVSPERSPGPAAPVFLLHGGDDNVIPAAESELLAASLARRGTPVHLLVTPLVTHAEVDRERTSRHIADLVVFWMRILRS